ncbi:MAG: CrcB family protein [Micrococcaceae bacterium]
MLFKTVGFKEITLVMIGGLAGTLVRYLLSIFLIPGYLPWGTLFANILGCFIMGLTVYFHPDDKLLWAIGFCGSLTTMSTFAYENSSAIIQHRYLDSFIYIATSVIAGAIAAFIGSKLAPKTSYYKKEEV